MSKKRPDKKMEVQFLGFMDGMEDCFEDLSEGAFQQAMQDSIDGENGWNEQNDDDLDAYECYMFWAAADQDMEEKEC